MATDLLTPVLTELLAECEAALDPKPARVLITPGVAAAYDDCCGGQLWVRLVSVAPVYPSNAVKGCGPLYRNVRIEVGVIRCAATLDSAGRPPTPAAVTADALQEALDLAAIEQVLECSDYGFTGLVWSPLGVEGGCQGGSWEGVIKVRACGC